MTRSQSGAWQTGLGLSQLVQNVYIYIYIHTHIYIYIYIYICYLTFNLKGSIIYNRFTMRSKFVK